MSEVVTKKCEGCNSDIHANQIIAHQAGLVGGVLLCPACIAKKREELLKARAAQARANAQQKDESPAHENPAAPVVADLGSNQGAVWFPPERKQAGDDEVLTLVDTPRSNPADPHTMIRSFSEGSTLGSHHKDTDFKRPVSRPDEPATRCRTFHGKLTDAGLSHMDEIINEWLDSHPDLFIKSCTSTVGVFEGKSKEPHLLVTVFY